MGLNVQQGTITAPGSTGIQTYSLPANFDPKILLVWMTYQTADGSVAANGSFTMGMGTKDGGAVQEVYMHGFLLGSQNAAEAAVHSFGTGSLLKGVNSNSTTVDFEVDLNDLVTGASSSFKLDWVDLPGTGSLLVHYLALGGTAITAARAGQWTTSIASTGENVTVATGWGQPDGVLFMGGFWNDADNSVTQNDLNLNLGVALSDTVRRTSAIHFDNGAASMTLASYQKAKAAVTTGSGVVADAEMDLDAKANWPTDGFKTAWSDAPGFAYRHLYLAWQGPMIATVGSASVPTGAPNQSQTLTGGASSTAKGALFWSTLIPTNASVDTTATGLGGFMVGGTDGTNEGVAAISELDGDAASQTGVSFAQTKALRMPLSVTGGAAPTVKSEADSALSGADVNLTWTTTDASVSREFNYIIFAETSSGQNVSATGLGSAQSFGTVTANPGGILVSVGGLGSAKAFGSPGIAVGNTNIAVPGLGSAAQFGSATPSGGVSPTFNPAVHGGKVHR